MKDMLRKIGLYGLLSGMILLTGLLAFAQQGDTDSAAYRDFITQIRQAYTKAHFLDFGIRYYYANAEEPQHYLDSLEGRIQMDKDNCILTLDGVETVLIGKYAIQINNADKSIYLAAARRAAAANPVSMLDSILAHIQGVQVAVTRQLHQESLTLDFPPDQAYSRITIQLDVRTGFLQRISYDLNTSRLVSQDMINSPGNPSPYHTRGRLEIVFSDYRQGKFDERLFHEDNFITRIAPGHFEPAGRYKDYHIYLASSNL
jgi:hypothetical protein